LQLFPSEIRPRDLSMYFQQLSENEDIYTVIEFELLNCLVARETGRYLEAFLFLYRILEGVSYSIPLMYVANQRSYTRSFNALKSFMSKNMKDGEIAFFKKFVQETYNQEEFFHSTIDIDMNIVDVEELKPVYYNLYRNKLKDCDILGETEDEELKISFIGFLIL